MLKSKEIGRALEKLFLFIPALSRQFIISSLFFSFSIYILYSTSIAQNIKKNDLSPYLVPSPCEYPTCSGRWIHGQVYPREKFSLDSQKNELQPLSAMPIECPEWIGWVEGRHAGVGAGIDYVRDKLVVVEKKKNNPKRWVFKSSYSFIDGWLFCQVEGIRARAVALRSRSFSRQFLIEVFDLDSGQKVRVENKLQASFGRTPWEQLLRDDVDFLPYSFYPTQSDKEKDNPVIVSAQYHPEKKTTHIMFVLKSGKKVEMENPGICWDFKVARNGTVGWIKDLEAKRKWSYLEFYKEGEIFLRIFGKYPQIQNWYFERGGEGAVFSSFVESKPVVYERYDLTVGQRIDYDETSEDKWLELKPWSKPLESEGKTTFWTTRVEFIAGKDSDKATQQGSPSAQQR
ncbi:hypothetical protein IT6_09630 [Methylacidiphilum caldifontis]|uniref:hypothetical protein n=1 Tax=Methylacidiphilum caldifontis TaxID=2795386 RepID=UPI001A8DFCB9|nr:hypothetical protein [Methylacidiphilum caldifontis]QSR88608.1 hypothetical protein IT6_09630 [Methylacidiphilum caldifontis]